MGGDLQIAISANGGWDLVLKDGDFVFVDEGPAEVGQRVVYRLMTWLGESPYDTGAGLPYLDGIFGFEPIPGIAGLLTQTILDTEGVDEIVDNPVFSLDGRELDFSIVIKVGTETATIETTVTA